VRHVILTGMVFLAIAGTADQARAFNYPVMFVIVDVANVRDSPSPNGVIVSRPEWGKPLRIMEKRGGWARVVTKGEQERWVLLNCLSSTRPIHEGTGTWEGHSYTFRRDRNLHMVALDPPIAPLDLVSVFGIRAITDAIFGESGADDRWPIPVSGSNGSLYRVSRASRDYWAVPVRDEAGLVSGLIIWPQIMEPAG
jgi:hypothetical protein